MIQLVRYVLLAAMMSNFVIAMEGGLQVANNSKAADGTAEKFTIVDCNSKELCRKNKSIIDFSFVKRKNKQSALILTDEAVVPMKSDFFPISEVFHAIKDNNLLQAMDSDETGALCQRIFRQEFEKVRLESKVEKNKDGRSEKIEVDTLAAAVKKELCNCTQNPLITCFSLVHVLVPRYDALVEEAIENQQNYYDFVYYAQKQLALFFQRLLIRKTPDFEAWENGRIIIAIPLMSAVETYFKACRKFCIYESKLNKKKDFKKIHEARRTVRSVQMKVEQGVLETLGCKKNKEGDCLENVYQSIWVTKKLQ